jgi:hypothetical protein
MNQVAFVSDMFVEHYNGGAELTTEAIIMAGYKNNQIAKLTCSQLTLPILENNKDPHYVICNFASLDDKVKLYMCKNIDYSIIEYDYKFCQYRSMEKHLAEAGAECDCLEQMAGKINSAFYGYASKVWFMSEAQKDIFLSKISVLKEENCEVLSSVFSPGDLHFMESIKNNEKNDKYLILGSNSWIKGSLDCIKYAEENELPYEVVQNLPYHELLIKMSTSKGLIFLPLGSDTCPRFVIEAKLLGCDVILNDYVQHKDEDWFQSQEDSYEYLQQRAGVFWNHYD